MLHATGLDNYPARPQRWPLGQGAGRPHHLDPGIDRTNSRLWGVVTRWLGNPDVSVCQSM